MPAQDHFDRLQRAQTPEEIHDAYRAALAAYDALNAQTIHDTGAHLDCCAGCSICCWLRIEVHAHEVFLIAHHIRSHFSEQEQADLLVRLTAHAERVLPLSPLEHATQNVVCPLLRNGRCSVYSVRPMACRRHHSLDVSACQYAFDHPTDLAFPGAHEPTLFRVLLEEMRQTTLAYAEAGFDPKVYELGTALDEALSDPESWEGWLSRMDAFVKASVTPAA